MICGYASLIEIISNHSLTKIIPGHRKHVVEL
jgi:hypothetical protein